jgi:hypothetical protein
MQTWGSNAAITRLAFLIWAQGTWAQIKNHVDYIANATLGWGSNAAIFTPCYKGVAIV